MLAFGVPPAGGTRGTIMRGSGSTVVRERMASPSVIVVGDVLQGLLHIEQNNQRLVAAG